MLCTLFKLSPFKFCLHNGVLILLFNYLNDRLIHFYWSTLQCASSTLVSSALFCYIFQPYFLHIWTSKSCRLSFHVIFALFSIFSFLPLLCSFTTNHFCAYQFVWLHFFPDVLLFHFSPVFALQLSLLSLLTFIFPWSIWLPFLVLLTLTTLSFTLMKLSNNFMWAEKTQPFIYMKTRQFLWTVPLLLVSILFDSARFLVLGRLFSTANSTPLAK